MSKPLILIVEDSESKRNSIQTVIERSFPFAEIYTALSVRSALDALDLCIPDVIVADMSLPTYDIEARERGGTPRPFGGIEVFEALERRDIVVPVLVVTSYPTIIEGSQSIGLPDLSKRLQVDFPQWYIGTVYFDPAFSIWEIEIISLLDQAMKGKYGT